MPSLYLLGWLLVQPLTLLFREISREELALNGTIVTFLLFLFLLPKWVKFRWRKSQAWTILGLRNTFEKNFLFALKGFLISFVLILLVLLPLFFGDWVINVSMISWDVLLNAIFLGFGVGFAEELVFRGWLLGEMNNLLGHRYGIFWQALIFSIAHIRFNIDLKESFSLLLGLFLLGIILALRRRYDSGSLWGSIGLHGGLVGGWFLINAGLIQFSENIPLFLAGPGRTSPNPIGGAVAIFWMMLMIFRQRKALTRF